MNFENSKCYRFTVLMRTPSGEEKRVYYVWDDCPLNARAVLECNYRIDYGFIRTGTLQKQYNGLFPQRTVLSEKEFEEKVKK